ncbi:MAG: DsrE family protein [Nitrospirota bacterium]|nr:MAG: DsrE family protein [Nitrospirota bacterium]
MSKMKVLFHVNQKESWDTALGNMINLIKDVGEDAVDIVVVANGPSVMAFIEQDLLGMMNELADKGAVFEVCRNSLKKMCFGPDACISEASLPSFVKVIPAGITEIIKKQAEGYAYVKP